VPPVPPLDEWRTRPMMLRLASGSSSGEQIGFNTADSVFEIETEHFVGKGYIRLRGLPDEPSAYFAGKKRYMSTTVQGRVKTPITMVDCSTGFEFAMPLLHLPIRRILQTCIYFFKAIAPAVNIDLFGPTPSCINPLFNAVQRLHVAKPGDEPDITAATTEQTTLLGGIFADRKIAWTERKRIFASPSAAMQQYVLDPALVYTFELYEDKLIPATWELVVASWTFPLVRIFGAGTEHPQPIQTMAKIGHEPLVDTYLFNVEMWHESLLMPANLIPESAASPAASPEYKPQSDEPHASDRSSNHSTAHPHPSDRSSNASELSSGRDTPR